MAKRLQTGGKFDVTADQMLGVMTDPELLRRQFLLQGALEVEVHEVHRDGQRLVQRIDTVEPARGVGGLIGGKTERAATTYEWRLAERACAWRYRGVHGDRVRIDGAIHIEPDGQAARVRSDIEVRVTVPLIGRMIEARIAGEIEQGFDPFERLLREFCGERRS